MVGTAGEAIGRARIDLGQFDPERFHALVDRSDPNGCWLWKGSADPGGYGRFSIRGGRKASKSRRAHRVAWVIAHGLLAPGACVLHRCDNRLCVNPVHLFLGSHADNNRDRDQKGRTSRGERHGRACRPLKGERNPCAKLTWKKVQEIRERLANGEGQRALGRELGIDNGSISRIATGKTWKHENRSVRVETAVERVLRKGLEEIRDGLSASHAAVVLERANAVAAGLGRLGRRS